MVYLSEEKMTKKARTLRENGAQRRGLIARKRALFFWVVPLTFGLCGAFCSISCGTAAKSAEKEAAWSATDISSTLPIESDQAPNAEYEQDDIDKAGKRKGAKELNSDLEQALAENLKLREENSQLRSEVIDLNEALVEAGQTIYSLNEKLDAIFKPEAGGN